MNVQYVIKNRSFDLYKMMSLEDVRHMRFVYIADIMLFNKYFFMKTEKSQEMELTRQNEATETRSWQKELLLILCT